MSVRDAVSRPRRPRRLLAIGAALALVLGVVATPAATAATARPAQVGLVSFVGASLTGSATATLTVSWPSVKGAARYEVFAAPGYADVVKETKPKVTVAGAKATIPGLARGKDYFVQVRAVSSSGVKGPRSSRVGHGTIIAEGTNKTEKISLLTWNLCSNVCAKFSTRAKLINKRLTELKPAVVTFQESSNYKTAPSGYGFGYKGQNAILFDKSKFTLAVDGQQTNFTSKHTDSGKGVSWAVLKSKATGRLSVVFSVHLRSGTTSKDVSQRVYETTLTDRAIDGTWAYLKAFYPNLPWSTATTMVAGDMNTHKSRTNDATLATFEKRGWFDAYDQARVLVRQHQNSANGLTKTTPTTSITWGDHIDKVLVEPSKTTVLKWANVQKMSGSKYVNLASDHLPIMVWLRTDA